MGHLKIDWDDALFEDLVHAASWREESVFSTTQNSMLRMRNGSSVDFIWPVQFYLITILGLLAIGSLQRDIGETSGISQATMS